MAKRSVVITLVLFAYASAAFPQTTTVTGSVLDARTAQPLSGVLVYLEDQSSSAISGSDGRFVLAVPSGRHTILASLIGYAVARHTLRTDGPSPAEIVITLSEGTGEFEEHISVVGSTRGAGDHAVAAAALYGRELQNLRGVMLDDPLRAVQALPSATASDDFYSEFAVRGNTFQHIGLTVDGIPSSHLMHTVHGATDGGSIAMINSETLGSVTLLPGSYPQRSGRRLGAQVDLITREGSRDRMRGRAGLSGTSATMLLEGPAAGGRGSWIVSARRSYLDLLIRQIDPDADFGFGFTDAQSKLVFDLSPRHQLQALAVIGRAGFEDEAEEIGTNDEAVTTSTSWLSGISWRYTPSGDLVLTQRVYATGLRYHNESVAGVVLDAARSMDLGWRGDATYAINPRALVEVGGDVQHLASRHDRRRTLDDSIVPSLLNSYDAAAGAASAYAQVTTDLGSRLTVTPGGRIDYWGLTRETTASPWFQADVRLGARTRARAGTGLHRQFANFEQVSGLAAAEERLRPERAVHADLGVEHLVLGDITVRLSAYVRREHDVLWRPGAEPLRRADGTIELGRGDASWRNSLEGNARGVELVVRRDAPSGLSGWAGYAYGRHRYRDRVSGESFWADADQRHTLSMYGHYRVSHRSSVSAKLRYGSNYPLTGYIGQQPFSAEAPPLFGGERPLFYGLVGERNTLRLPAYARLDVRGDRSFTWANRRVTAFAEVANLLNRTNMRNVPYGIDTRGRVLGPTDSLMPIVPSAGFVVEF